MRNSYSIFILKGPSAVPIFIFACITLLSLSCVRQIEEKQYKRNYERATEALAANRDAQLPEKNETSEVGPITFKKLLTENYLQDYEDGWLTENYSLWASVDEGWDGDTSTPSPFTVVAFPLPKGPPGYLATFSLREDMILRVYHQEKEVNAWGENDDYGTLTWEPIK